MRCRREARSGHGCAENEKADSACDAAAEMWAYFALCAAMELGWRREVGEEGAGEEAGEVWL